MKINKNLLLGISLATATTFAQDISVEWIQHYNLPESEILHPLIKKAPVADSLANGQSLMVSYAGIQRYDADRLVLGIRENGINEAGGMTPAQQEIAEKYPDQSLVWIDANTGEYLGIAHRLRARPVPMEPDWEAAGGALDFLFWTWAFDQAPAGEKAIYATYNNKIVRYAPKAGGGWEDTPTLAFEEPTPGTAAANEALANGIPLSDSGPWQQWRPADLKIGGSGADTWIWVGNKTWRNGQHNQLLSTEDGLTFKPVARLNDRDGARKNGVSGSGSSTRPLRYGQDPDRPNLLTVMEFHYPATGAGPQPTRYTWDPDDSELLKESNREDYGGFWGTSHPWEGGENRPYRKYDPEMQVGFFNPSRAAVADFPAWEWDQGPRDDQGNQYDGFWGQILEGHEELDYVVSYSSPSWADPADSFRPGWVAVHSIEGKRTRNSQGQFSAVKLPITGADQPEAGVSPNRNPFIAVYGDVEVIADPANPGEAEVLWVGRTYGFGKFRVKSIPAALVSSPSPVTTVQNRSFTLSAEFTGGVNRYQWFKDGEAIPGATDTRYTVEMATLADSGSYSILARNVLGNVESAAATVTVLPDNEPPVPVSAGIIADPFLPVLGILFDEPVDPVSATTLANYSFPAGNGAFAINITPDNLTVRLLLNGPLPSGSSVGIVGVRDLAGNATAAGTSVTAVNSNLRATDFGDFVEIPSTSAALGADGFAVEARAGDIWGTTDAFHFLYQEVTGDFDVAVKIESSQSNNNWARNSIMLRESLLPNSYHVSVGATPLDPARGFYAHYRGPLLPNGEANLDNTTHWWNNDGTPNGPAFNGPIAYSSLPVWVRLVRSGNQFTAYRSTTGTTWIHFGDVNVELPPTAMLGLATSMVTYTRYSGFGAPTIIEELGHVVIQLEGSTVTLSWDGPGVLQSAPTPEGPWADVEGATSPVSTEAGGTETYYRLRN